MTTTLADEIVAACRRALPSRRPLPLHEPTLGEPERRAVDECLQSGWISTAGPYVDRFESALAAYTGARHVIATVNGTSALHGALLALGIKPGDAVLLPSLTFVATANAVAYCGAVPYFVDVSPHTLGVCPDALERRLAKTAQLEATGLVDRATGRPIRALIVMHAFGHPADMRALQALAARWQLALVEDAAESLGTTCEGRHTGTLGHVGVLSFNGNKIATTGGGGAILTDDAALARRARHLCTTARIGAGWHFMHDEVGYNYRLPSVNAAIGLAQIERLPRLLAAKRRLAGRYAAAFAGFAGATLFRPADFDASNHWLNTLVLDEEHADGLDATLAALTADGIQARPAWTPMHQLPMHADAPRMPLPITESLARRIVNLPSSADLAGTEP